MPFWLVCFLLLLPPHNTSNQSGYLQSLGQEFDAEAGGISGRAGLSRGASG